MVAELAGGGIGIDVEIIEPDFSPFDAGVTVHQIGLAVTQRFYFRPAQDHSGLHRVFDEVIVPRLFVLADYFDAVHDLFWRKILTGLTGPGGKPPL